MVEGAPSSLGTVNLGKQTDVASYITYTAALVRESARGADSTTYTHSLLGDGRKITIEREVCRLRAQALEGRLERTLASGERRTGVLASTFRYYAIAAALTSLIVFVSWLYRSCEHAAFVRPSFRAKLPASVCLCLRRAFVQAKRADVLLTILFLHQCGM